MTIDSISDLEISAHTIPTDHPEGDGTFAWDSVTMILCQVRARSGARGLGFTYGPTAVATLAQSLRDLVLGAPVEAPGHTWDRLLRQVRNDGRPGVAAGAISALDIALWDLLAHARGISLRSLLGAHRDAVPVYGSGGFTTYTDDVLREQLGRWVHEQGFSMVKMKIGTDWGTRPDLDLHRVEVARQAIGERAQLFVDANGAYSAKAALRMARGFRNEFGVSYFEEPVSSDHLDQLRRVRQGTELDVAAGEYGYDPWYFRRMLQAEAVDVLQADASRCLGVTGWLQAAALAHAFGVTFSAHTMPAVHAHLGCAAPAIAHLEYFHTHARAESMLFDGTLDPRAGVLTPDASRAGLGLEPKPDALDRYRAA